MDEYLLREDAPLSKENGEAIYFANQIKLRGG